MAFEESVVKLQYETDDMILKKEGMLQMKAVIQPKINQSKRIPLETVVPRRYPFSVDIDPCSSCNFSCKFCFQHDKSAMASSGYTHRNMDMGLFKKLLGDLRGFEEYPAKIRLGSFGEPLINGNICDMVSLINVEKSTLMRGGGLPRW